MINVLILTGLSFLHPTAQRDSIGSETINGKVFVIYKVGEKETLYGISKRYGTTVDAITQANPGMAASLEIGQVLKVPYTAPKTPVRPAGGIVHVVTAGETMFSIAKAYNVREEDIRQWNSLSGNALSVGQEVVIRRRNTNTNVATTSTPVVTQPNISRKSVHTVETKETLYSIARQYGASVAQIREWNNLSGDELSVGQTLFVSQPERGTTVVKKDPEVTPRVVVAPANDQPKNDLPKNEPKNTTPVVVSDTPVKQPTQTTTPATSTIRITQDPRNSDEVREAGIAELIEGTEGNRKYLALHRTAPVGTILKVRNEMNNREVFVRVMGKLQDPSGSDKLVIRISKSAYDRLGALDPRFRVEITYYK